MFDEFITSYGATIIYTVLTAIAGWIGVVLKNVYTKYINDKTKKAVVKTCVEAVEQLYKELNGEEKFDKCIEAITEMLTEKGITITELEVKMLLEASVHQIKNSFYGISDCETSENLIEDIPNEEKATAQS